MAGRPRTVKLSPLGERIRELLPASKTPTRAALISALGVAPATLRRWEVGEAEPGRADLHLLAELLRTTPRYLETGESEHKRPASSEFGRHFGLAERFADYLQRKLSRPTEDEYAVLLALVRLHPIVHLYVNATDAKLSDAARNQARRLLVLRLSMRNVLSSPDQIDLFAEAESDEVLEERAEQRLREHLKTGDIERAIRAIRGLD
jgi:transcriptional regulator with XRE-family HTH domain